MGYNFEIKYRPRITNGAADALSGHPNLAHIQLAIVITSWQVDWAALKRDIDNDDELTKLRAEVASKSTTIVGFHLHNEQLMYNDRVVIPATSPLIPKLLFEFHDSGSGVTMGNSRPTYALRFIGIGWA